MFYFDKISNLTVLKSDFLSGINHFFTTRESIIKSKEEDKILTVKKNLETIKKEFCLDRVLSPKQTHTTNIEFVTDKKESFPQTDALILKDKNTGIFLNFADCTPVILYDSKNNAAAVIHAGWRGTAGKIVQKTFRKMQTTLNSNPEDVIAVIGPCICFSCFETSKEIMDKLSDTVFDKSGIVKAINGKFYADLKTINARQLKAVGVNKIDISPYCTVCNNDIFYSYRKENKTTNRISAFVSLLK